MTDRPILFSAPMIRALLDGRKTQTRRLLNPQPKQFPLREGGMCDVALETSQNESWPRVRLGRVITRQEVPFAVGQRLWVREAWAKHASGTDYAADLADASRAQAGPWKSGRFMPRAQSRLTLTVTNVRVERLQDISEDDARAEGASCLTMDADGKFYENARGNYYTGFSGLWDHIHGPGAWDENPWVAAVTFDVRKGNIDAG